MREEVLKQYVVDLKEEVIRKLDCFNEIEDSQVLSLSLIHI